MLSYERIKKLHYFKLMLNIQCMNCVAAGRIHEVVPLSEMPSSGVLKLPTRTITLRGGASVVQGQHGSAIR